MSFLRKSEAQTDLRFVMAASTASKPKLKDGPGGEIVLAHKAIFARHSTLMRDIFDIAEKKQVQQLFLLVTVMDAVNYVE